MGFQEFKTAPIWYRPLLWAEVLAASVVFIPQRYKARKNKYYQLQGGEMNYRYNPLTGHLAAERIIPRQTRKDVLDSHNARYQWASERILNDTVADLGCGTGYSTSFMSEHCKKIVGLDISSVAITEAQETYPKLDFYRADLTRIDSLPEADIAVCFEVIEHVTDPLKVIQTVIKRYPRALFSIPNPLWNGSHLNPHHIQNLPLSVCKKMMRQAGAGEITVYSQGYRDCSIIQGGKPWMNGWLFDCKRK